MTSQDDLDKRLAAAVKELRDATKEFDGDAFSKSLYAQLGINSREDENNE